MANSIEEEPVLSVYFEAEAEILAADNEDNSSKPKKSRNVEPMEQSTPKPPIDYETKVPSNSTIIAMISHRRVDRVTPEQAWRTDVCLPCGQEGYPSSSSSKLTRHPQGLELHKLPCHHVWCTQCLARAFLFAKNNNTFDRLRCCNNEEDIPLRYFERIAQDGAQPPPTWETQKTGTKRQQIPTTLSDSTTNGGPAGGKQLEQQLESEDTSTTFPMPSIRNWNPIRVVPLVEQDREVFITKGDIASYKESLLEFNTLPKDRVYCPRTKTCGSLIPLPKSRQKTKDKTTVSCPKCSLKVCLRCRKNPSSHTSKSATKCTAGNVRMEVVKNDRKLLVLARRKGWKRCPRCRMFVEKMKGTCSSVSCFCGRYFFYG